jgi:cytoskeletal protein CcmA (bactofilin family)
MLPNFTAKRPRSLRSPISAASAPSNQPAPSTRTDADARPGERGAPSIIARDLVVLGNVVCQGELQIEGNVEGDIHGAKVVIGEHGRVTGGIVSGEVVVRGQVMGSIRGKRVVLQASSQVDGEIYHQSLTIEPGAYFEGKSRRCEDPTAGVQRPQVASASRDAEIEPE